MLQCFAIIKVTMSGVEIVSILPSRISIADFLFESSDSQRIVGAE